MSSSSSYAQYYNPKCRYTSVGFSVKASYFDGDIATPIQYVRPGIGVNITRRITPRISLTSELMWLRIMGDDMTSSNLQTPNKIAPYIRNLHFRNDIKELAFSAKYDLFPSADHYRKRPIYNLYGSIGLSLFYHNPKARIFKDTNTTKTKWVALKPLQTENKSYSNFQIALPLAIGVRYKLSLQWDMEVEVGYRFTLTDYIDDVSGKYPNPNLLKSDLSRSLSNRSAEPISALSKNERDLLYLENELAMPVENEGGYKYLTGAGPGTSRGSKKGYDGFVVIGVRFLYAIPGTVNCPKFREF
jgi:hypothetical protein